MYENFFRQRLLDENKVMTLPLDSFKRIVLGIDNEFMKLWPILKKIFFFFQIVKIYERIPLLSESLGCLEF